MKTLTMTDEEKNNIAVGTEVVATHDMGAYSVGDILIITEQDYDYMPTAIKKGDDEKFGGMYIHVDDFEVLDTSTTVPTTTAVKLLPGERPKYGVVYTVTSNSWSSAMGWEVVLETDDGTPNPWFVRTNGLSMEGFTRIAVTLDRLTYEPEQTATPTPTQSDEEIKRSLSVGTRVRLTTELGNTPGLQVGCEGCIVEQDGSCMPRVMLDGFLYAKGLHVRTEGFEAIPEEQPVEVTQDNLAFGQVYKVLDNTASGADEGDLLVLKRNDGSDCPFFYNISDSGEQACAWLEALVAVNVIESKQSKELET